MLKKKNYRNFPIAPLCAWMVAAFSIVTAALPAQAYIHPGAPLTLSDLQAVKANVDANREPWKSGYASLAGATQLTYTMKGPFAQVSRVGAYDQNLAAWRNDMNAIWNLALMWYFTGDTAYAQKAHHILLAWATTNIEFSGNESMLDLGDYAYRFVGGADILRGTWPGWMEADTTAVKDWFANVLQPGADPWGDSMYGAANKGALALVAQGLMAIFNDDTVMLDDIAYQARTLAHVGLRSSNDIGMLGDSLRDQGHAHVQLFSLTILAEALWKQGIDIYPDYNNRLLAAGEYYARVNDLSVATPFLPFGTTDQYYIDDITNRGFHAGATAFSILHNAYVVRKGIPAPNMTRRLQEMPPSWLFLKDADLSTATPAPALAIPATTSITSGFSNAEIGGASPAGNSSYSGGTWTVQGAGWSIWGPTDDGCHFTYKAVTGDCAIIAKVESVQNTHQSARAGVMIRTSLDEGAPRAWMAVTPSSQFQQNIQGLAVYGGINYGNKSYTIPQSSYWVKLERLGNMVTGYVSQDGTNWAATDVGRLDDAPATWYVGLVVSSTSGSLNTSTFSNVQITGGDGGAPIVTPAAPAAFLAAPGENAVSLRWQPSFGAASYTVNRATTSGGPYSTVAAGVTASSYTDKTVTNGTTYYYVVTAINSAGTSVNSPEDNATPFSPMVNVAFGGTASSSAIGAPSWEAAAQAFNRNSASKWFNGNASNPGPTGWLRYDFGANNAQVIKRYTVVSADVADRDPKDWTFQGSNDGSTWMTLDTQSNQAFVNRNHANTYNIGSPAAYRYYQIDVTANNGGGALAIGELGLWSDIGRTVLDGTYRIINRNSNKVMDVTGSTNGALLVQQTYTGADSQQWDIAWQGNGQYSATGVASTKVIDNGGSSSEGDNLAIQPWSGGDSQLWTILPAGDGFYRIESANSGLVADVSGGSTADGANIIQETYSGSDSQQWMLGVATTPQPIPPVPTGLGATPATLSQINLSWTASPGAISYNIKRATVSGGPYTNIAESVNTTNYSSTGLTADTTYYYVVAAVNGSGESPDSAQASATTLATPPDAPTDLTAILGTSRVTLDWIATGGAASYNVKRATTSGGPYTTVASGVTSTSYTDTGISHSVTYYYYVVSASNAIGTGPDSAELAVGAGTLICHLKFDETGGAIAADSSGRACDATLVNGPTFAPGTFGNALNLPATSFQYASLPSGIASGLTDFTISIWVNVNDFALWQRIFDFGTGTDNYMFLAAQGSAGTGKPRFTIRTPSVAEQYIDSSIALPTNAWTHVAVTRSGNTVSLYVNGALAGSGTITLNPSDLGVTTQNYLGKSQWPDPYLNSALDDFRIYCQTMSAGEIYALAHPSAGAPLQLNAVAGYGQATLSWLPNATTTYTVKRSTTSGGPYTTVASGVTNLTYTDTGLTNGVTYYYVVDGSGPDSAEVSALPQSLWGAATVACWTFEEGTANTYVPYSQGSSGQYDGSVLDVSGNGNHLSTWAASWDWYRADVPAAVTPQTGITNTLSVQNANNYNAMSAIGTSLTTWNPTNWTIEATFKANSTSGTQTVVGRDSYGAYSGNAQLSALYLGTSGSSVSVKFTDNAGNYWSLVSAAGVLEANQWQALAAVSDGSTLSLYLKNITAGEVSYAFMGTLNISGSADSALTTGAGDGDGWDAGVFSVGRGLYNGVHTDRVFGHIDDVRISNAALSPNQFLYSTPVPPPAPTGLSAVSADSQVALAWNAVANAMSYNVKRSLTSGGSYDPIDSPVGTGLVDSGLTNGTVYYYVVSSVGIGGEGMNSVEVGAVPSVALSPDEFLFAEHAVVGGTNLSLTVLDSVPGHDYGILATDSLVPPDWSHIAIEAGTGSDILFNLPITPVESNRYFKLDVQRQ